MDKTQFLLKCSQVYAKMISEVSWDHKLALFEYLERSYNSKMAKKDIYHKKSDVFYKAVFDCKRASELERLPLDKFVIFTPQGGISGGSCWSSSNPQRYFHEEAANPAFIPEVEALLTEEGIRPLTFKEFDEYRKLYEGNKYIHREYYGNESHYLTLELDFEKLWYFYSEHRV